MQNIDFTLEKGEVLGVIGKNGVGKSTLLKILSKVTAPSKGNIKIKGRVASLLEVGTGFHPELTGIENIFLNGAILGMRKSEIQSKLDEIIHFAGIEKYANTPVKRYSSGMYVRLAFAVAAHLEPEILVVDEVLAVGDAEFQKKALGKMKEVATGEGRTVLFVSHNMAAIRNLCSKGMVLENGQKTFEGETSSAIQYYLNSLQKISLENLEAKDRKGTAQVLVKKIYMLNEKDEIIKTTFAGAYTKFVFEFEKEKNASGIFAFDLRFNDALGHRLSWLSTRLFEKTIQLKEVKNNQITLVIEKMPLNVGSYSLTFYCTLNEIVCDWVEDAFQFEVETGEFFSTGKLPFARNGSFLIEHYFEI